MAEDSVEEERDASRACGSEGRGDLLTGTGRAVCERYPGGGGCGPNVVCEEERDVEPDKVSGPTNTLRDEDEVVFSVGGGGGERRGSFISERV